MTDALGNEIIIGSWYGYSRSDGGFSHTTIGCAKKVKEGDGQYTPAKVRLAECVVKRFLYGQPTEPLFPGEKSRDITIATYMVFPVPHPLEK